MTVLLQAIRGVAGGVAHGLRALAWSMLLLDVLYASLLAVVAFWIAAHGSWVRGVLAACLALVLAIIVGTIVAVHVSIVRMARVAVERAALGRLTLDALVERLPVSPEAGWTLDELETGLNRAGTQILGESPPARMFALPFWLASQVQRIVVWTSVRIILRQASREHEGARRVDIAAVRDRLAEVIDRMTLERAREQVVRVCVSLVAAVTAAVALLALLIRLAPI